MREIKYAFFLDFHTSPSIRNLGSRFQADEFARRLSECGVNFLTFPARCNMGMAYYDTQIGTRHYGLAFDLFGELVEACRKREIAVCAYFNGGISQEETRLHPEWQARLMHPQPFGSVTPFVRTACCNTAYHDHLIAMMCEVAEKYPVAGFFIDCMGASSCLCESCLEQMKKAGIRAGDYEANHAFTRKSVLRFAGDIARAVRKQNPDFLIYFNGIGYEEQADCSSYLDFECIPTKNGCDYEYLPVLSRYMRTLNKRPHVNMTGRFHLWGDFGGLRPETALRQELLTGLANGMRPNIGDHMLPDGTLCEGAFRQSERIYHFLQKYETYYTGAEALADMAVCFPKTHDEIRSAVELRGVARMLCELHRQFDIVNARGDWSRYPLLVLPDSVRLDEPLTKKLRNYLASGGKVIASGISGLGPDGRFPPEWPVEYIQMCDFSPAYFRTEEMASGIYENGILMKAASGAETVFRLTAPAVNREWDGLYAQYYNPPEEETVHPFLVWNGRIAHFSHRIFSGYKQYGSIPLRNAFAAALEKIAPDELLRTNGLPRFVRATMTRQKNGRTMIHLLAHIPERRALHCDVIEEDLIVPECTISVKSDCNSAFLAQDQRMLPCRRAGRRLEISIPSFCGYALLVLE